MRFKDYYKIMGVAPSASQDRIRRAYRTLARRYHPDVNPGKASSDKFKEIAEAYQVLKNPDRRSKYDREYAAAQYQKVDRRVRAYQQAQKEKERKSAEKYYQEQKQDYESIKKWQKSPAPKTAIRPPKFVAAVKRTLRRVTNAAKRPLRRRPSQPRQVMVFEVPLSMREAVLGAVKDVTIPGELGGGSLRFTIPPGMRTGAVLEAHQKHRDVVCIAKVERHQFLSIEPEGLVVDVPVTVNEAISGAAITVPTLDEPVTVRVQPATQSGARIRVKGKGIIRRDGPEDLIVRVMIHVPESDLAVGIKERGAELDPYYESGVRQRLPKTLHEILDKTE